MEKLTKYYINTQNTDTGVCNNRANTLLLAVDQQPRLMEAMENGERGIYLTTVLQKAFRQYNMPVLATEQYPKGLGRLDERIAELVDEDKVYEKTIFDAVTPEVVDFIEENRISNVVVVGAEAHICVYQTVRTLLAKGLNVFLVEDAVNSASEKLKKTAIKSMREMGAVIVNTEMILFDIAYDAKDPNFKFVSNLVKEIRS